MITCKTELKDLTYEEYLKMIWGEKGPPKKKTTDEELHRTREKVFNELEKMSEEEQKKFMDDVFK